MIFLPWGGEGLYRFLNADCLYSLATLCSVFKLDDLAT